MIQKSLLILVTMAISSNAFWWGTATARQQQEEPIKQVPLGYFRTYTYHPFAYQPQQPQPQQYVPMTNYQVSPPRQLPNNFSTRQLSPQQPSFTRNLAEPLVAGSAIATAPLTPVKESPETKPPTDSTTTTTSAAATAAATSTTTTNSETSQLPPLPVPQPQQQPFHFKPNQMPTHSNFMQPQNQMGQMNHMGQMNNHISHMMMKPQQQQQQQPQQQQSQQQSHQQFNMPDPVNLQYMTNVAPLSVQNIQFVPCMCPVSVTMTPDGLQPTADKRSDDISNYSYDSIQDIPLDENL